MDEVPPTVRLSLEVDGFTAVLPLHWLAAALLGFLAHLSATLGFILGTVAAAMLAMIGLMGLALLLPPLGSAVSVPGIGLVLALLVGLGCLGAARGQALAERGSAALEAWLTARQPPLRLQGRLLTLGRRRVPLADVADVAVRGWAVVLLLHSGERQTLCAPAYAAVREWLAEVLRAALVQQQTVGSPEDIPEAMRAIQQDTARRGEKIPG